MTEFSFLGLCALYLMASHAWAGNCLVHEGGKVGDCANVHVGPPLSLNVKKSGSYSGNFGQVTVHPGVRASISANTGDVTVKAGATLHLSGNSERVLVEGVAELNGNSGWVSVAQGGLVTIRGIADGASGPGKVVKVPGAIIGGVYIAAPASAR